MDKSTEEKRTLLEEYGYTPEVITFLGFSCMKGVGFHSLRKIGGHRRLVDLLNAETAALLDERLSAFGLKLGLSALSEEEFSDIRKKIWTDGGLLALQLVERGVYFIWPGCPKYPHSLWDLVEGSRPHWLFVRGNYNLLDQPLVAVVGTRKPTRNGDFLTRSVVSLLGQYDIPVVSGLAYGIDTIAHEAALNIDLPTVSVLGNGILNPYPARNAGLADQIVEQGGALVSEYLPHDSPTADSFVWRNRIQACLSRLVIGTEWKASSGTAHTIRFAQGLFRRNVSMFLSRARRDPDAGIAEVDIEWPNDWVMLEELILAAVDERSERPLQGDLF